MRARRNYSKWQRKMGVRSHSQYTKSGAGMAHDIFKRREMRRKHKNYRKPSMPR